MDTERMDKFRGDLVRHINRVSDLIGDLGYNDGGKQLRVSVIRVELEGIITATIGIKMELGEK